MKADQLSQCLREGTLILPSATNFIAFCLQKLDSNPEAESRVVGFRRGDQVYQWVIDLDDTEVYWGMTEEGLKVMGKSNWVRYLSEVYGEETWYLTKGEDCYVKTGCGVFHFTQPEKTTFRVNLADEKNDEDMIQFREQKWIGSSG